MNQEEATINNASPSVESISTGGQEMMEFNGIFFYFKGNEGVMDVLALGGEYLHRCTSSLEL